MIRNALLALAVGAAGLLATGGNASAACEPPLDVPACRNLLEPVLRAVDQMTCLYHPDLGYVGCD